MKKILSVLLSISMILGLFSGTGIGTEDAKAAVVIQAGIYSLTAAANNKVVCAENYGNDPLTANRDAHGGNWEEFTVVNNSDGTISLKSEYNEKYICAVIDEENQLLARSEKIDAWEKFELEHITGNQYALKAVANGKYVKADLDNNAVLTAASDSIGGAWEAFEFTLISSLNQELDWTPRVTKTDAGFEVQWDAYDNADGYDVYRAESRFGTYSKIATINGLSYTDTAPNADKYANYYKVAVAGKSELSKPASLEIEMFGEDMYVFSPKDDIEQVYQAVNHAYLIQGDVSNGTPGPGQQFGNGRYAFAFKTGDYSSMAEDTFNVSYYMHLLGLGKVPTDVTIKNVHVPAVLSNDNATCNFWMSIENLAIAPSQYGDSDEYWQFKWAVSQAAPARRLYVNRSAKLNNYDGYASGGFIADSVFTNNLGSNTQQQYYIRNTQVNGQISGVNWNMVMQGVNYGSTAAANFQDLQGAAGKTNWASNGCYTVLDATDIIREKPFLYFDESEKEYKVFIPDIRKNSSGTSWTSSNMGEGVSVDISKFYIARADRDNAGTINAALAAGKNILLSPGIYYAEEPIQVDRANTVILGLGLATIIPTNTEAAIKVADVGGVSIAGVVLDADSYSKNMLVLGEEGCNKDHSANPTVLQDVFVRIGGVHGGVASTDAAIVINSNNVIGDDFWIWRADHGDGVGWYLNTAKNGLVVNGDDVTLYGLMVEHFQEYDVIWRGENGKTYFLQNEKCYDPQSQSGWMSHNGTANGYAAYKVSNYVKNHYAVGLGSYDVFIYTNGASIVLDNAIELPDTPGVMIENVCIVELASGGDWDEYKHIVNGTGPGITSNAYAKEVLLSYNNHRSVSLAGEEYGNQLSDDPLADGIINKEAKSADSSEMYVIDYWKANGQGSGEENPNPDPDQPQTGGMDEFKIVGYVPNWYGAGYLDTIDYSQVTNLIYAFAIPTTDGTILSLNDGGFMEALVSKAHANGVKVSIAIGGWSYNNTPLESTFAEATNTDAKCKKLADAMLAVVDAYGLDGIDVDWEYPRSNTSWQYETLIRYLREGLDARGEGKILTAAVAGTTTEGYSAAALGMLDWVNIMAYDGDSGAGHSPYEYAVSSTETWKNAGLSKEQLVVGVPFYERPNWASYKDIVAANSANAYKDSTVINGTTVYYNGLDTIAKKTKYACENAGGIMIWEMSQDSTNKDLSLLNKIYQTAKETLGDAGSTEPVITTVSMEEEAVLSREKAFAVDGSLAPAAVGSYTDYLIDVKESGTYAITYYIKAAGNGTGYPNALSVYTGEPGTRHIDSTAGYG